MVSIAFDTEKDDYERVLAILQVAYGLSTPSGEVSPTVGNGERPMADEEFWNADRLATFAKGLADAAAEAVRYIAANAPEVSLDRTMKHVGSYLGEETFSGQKFGGHMASVGFSAKQFGPNVWPPFDTDYKYRVYHMGAGIASTLGEIMGEPKGVEQ